MYLVPPPPPPPHIFPLYVCALVVTIIIIIVIVVIVSMSAVVMAKFTCPATAHSNCLEIWAKNVTDPNAEIVIFAKMSK